MKTIKILKTVGLVSAFSFSSFALISCDSNDSDSSEDIGQSSTDLPADASELENGGVITIDISGDLLQFLIIDAESGLGNLTLIDGDESTINNLTLSYNIADSGSITISDNRLSDQEVLNEINSLTGEGGAVENELNAVLSNDTEENLADLLNAINAITRQDQFSVDDDDDGRVVIFRSILLTTAGEQVVTQIPVVGESNPFSLDSEAQSVDNFSINITYTAP